MYIQHRTQDTEQAQEKQKAQHRKLTTLAEQHKKQKQKQASKQMGLNPGAREG